MSVGFGGDQFVFALLPTNYFNNRQVIARGSPFQLVQPNTRRHVNVRD
jgi:hypothetical protein